MEEQTVEEMAREQGWTPQDEYKGDPDNWKSAEKFIEVGKKISAVQSERNDKLLREISSLKNDIASFKDVHAAEMKAVKEDTYNRAVQKLKDEQREALRAGDEEEFDKIEQKIKETPKPKPVEKQEQPVNEEFIKWAAENPWYDGEDVELTQTADIVAKTLQGNYTDMTKFYNAIGDRVKKMYPEKFDIKTPVQDVEQSSGGTSKKKGKHSYSDLPGDAKAACDKYVKMGLYTKADYVKEYYAGE